MYTSIYNQFADLKSSVLFCDCVLKSCSILIISRCEENKKNLICLIRDKNQLESKHTAVKVEIVAYISNIILQSELSDEQHFESYSKKKARIMMLIRQDKVNRQLVSMVHTDQPEFLFSKVLMGLNDVTLTVILFFHHKM